MEVFMIILIYYKRYQPSAGQAACEPGSVGYKVEIEGSSQQVPCAVGTFQEATGQVQCEGCEKGQYQVYRKFSKGTFRGSPIDFIYIRKHHN